uniref:Uncharacterized protein n=1 Tax=Cannabis sativa TaxID=3483 RepID=A0A803QDK3_CANSA
MEAGATFPLHPFFVEVLAYFGLSPLQLSLVGYTIMTCFAIAFKGVDDRFPMVAEFQSIFNIHHTPGSPSTYYFSKIPSPKVYDVARMSSKIPFKPADFFIVDRMPDSVSSIFRVQVVVVRREGIVSKRGSRRKPPIASKKGSSSSGLPNGPAPEESCSFFPSLRKA